MARNVGQHGGFLCLSSMLIQHWKWRIYIEYAWQPNVLRNNPYFCHINLTSARLKHYKIKQFISYKFHSNSGRTNRFPVNIFIPWIATYLKLIKFPQIVTLYIFELKFSPFVSSLSILCTSAYVVDRLRFILQQFFSHVIFDK